MLRRAPPLCAATTPRHVKGSSSSSSSSSGSSSLCRGASVRNTRGGSCTLRVGIRARARAAVASAVARSELPGHLCYRAAGVDDARRVVDFLAAATDGPPRDAARMARALESSYASLLALDGDDPSRRVVGFARVVSDGAFVAVIADLALDGALVADSPRHGVAFVRRLRDEVARIGRARGGPLGVRPTSLAAFAAGTEERTAFWRMGFRIDMRHTVMRYVGEGANEAPGTKRGSGYALLPRSSDGATGGAEKGADEESEGSRR